MYMLHSYNTCGAECNHEPLLYTHIWKTKYSKYKSGDQQTKRLDDT